ncbi:hypothetical protein FRD01_19780 [Microvenator marinus]|uniref:Uncharacterized protein n=1 Tax=Microvenator marinus TaxID=2600177 RepID=A0A5B8XVJ6_9DELT|nr:hypothetical protein [Microvenator marinus]QED29434.1 hypothetical protein FRD01_19780 [Microvenator marinus]
MPHPPLHAADYTPDDLELVRAGCLEVATSLGDLMKQVVPRLEFIAFERPFQDQGEIDEFQQLIEQSNVLFLE